MRLNKLLILPAILCLISGCQNGGENQTGPITDYDGYYQSINYDDTGSSLIRKIHDLMIDSHTKYPTYSVFKNTATYKKTCINPATSKIVSFYSGKETASYSGSREHVWACANSNELWGRTDGKDIGEDYKGGGADMYHIMPCSSALNTYRGNAKFYEFEQGETFYERGDSGGKYKIRGNKDEDFCDRVEVADEMKGDVARILAYLYVHYTANFGKTNKYTGQLQINNIVYRPGTETNQYCFDKLIKWNELDPVDEMEKNRCNEVQKEQGNRNPFIDHPEFMAKAFGLDE